MGIRTAQIDVLTLNFIAERLKPGRHLCGDSTLVKSRRSAARPFSARRSDADQTL
jgi:hypothetical protein